jgi:hypothetical protein
MSATRSIVVTHEVTDEFLEDIMVTMVESDYDSLFYWVAEVMSIDRGENLNVKRIKFRIQAADFTVVPRGIGQKPGVFVIDHEAVATGIRRILSGEARVSDDIVSSIARAVADNDADIDAIGADCIAQAFCFNQVVYG